MQTSHNQRPEISKALKPLKTSEKRNLSLSSNFAFVGEAGCVHTKVGAFYAATYGDCKVPVTLLLSPLAAEMSSREFEKPCDDQIVGQDEQPRSAFSLCPVTKFIDESIPSRLISGNESTPGKKKSLRLVVGFTLIYDTS